MMKMIGLGQGVEVNHSSCTIYGFPIASLPLSGARLHSLDIFLHFIQFIVSQFTLDTVVGGPSAVESSLEGRQFALKSCRLLKQE